VIDKRLSDEELIVAIEQALKDYRGYLPTIESAIGALFAGKAMGWKVLRIVHNEKTILNYQKLLGVNFRAQMEETTPLSRKSLGFLFAEKIDGFAKLLRGEVSYDKRSWVKRMHTSADE